MAPRVPVPAAGPGPVAATAADAAAGPARSAPVRPAAAPLPMSPRLLLGPGPSMVHPRVLAAMTAPLIGYLDPEFLRIMDGVVEMLRYAFGTEDALVLPVSGTGSAAMETAIANTIEPGDSVLVCVNGYFGLRLAEMGRRYGGEVETIERPWGEVFAPDEIAAALDRRPARVVAIVQGETSTGALQPLGSIPEIVHAHGGLLVVDAVTTLGGVPVAFDATDIDVCYSGSQKCLGAPPGLGPVAFGRRAMDRLAARTQPVRTWYLDLALLARYWGSERVYHHTAPISTVFALYEALRLVAEEGLEARWERHRVNARLLWDGLAELGLALHVAEADRLAPLTTVRVPEDVDEPAVRARLLAEYGIEIGAGFGELKGRVWRIGLMGHSSRPENVEALLGALRRVLGR